MPNANQKAADFRKTAAGVKLGKILFTQDLQRTLTSPQIVNLMLAAGIPVPKGTVIAADTAQLIIAGGAFTDAADEASAIGDLINPGIGVIKAAADLLAVCGLMDARSPAAQVMNLGIQAAMVIAAGGLNILADIGFALTLITDLFCAPDTRAQMQALSKQQAQRWDSQYINAVYIASKKQAAHNFAMYQSGQLSLFQYVNAIAQESPELFYEYFPKLGAFLPPASVQRVVTTAGNEAQHGGFAGVGTSSSWEVASFTGTYKQFHITPQALAQDLINQLILKPWGPYGWLNSACGNTKLLKDYGYPLGCAQLGVKKPVGSLQPLRRLTIQDWSILSLIPPYPHFALPTTDIRRVMLAFGITPHDLGYDIFNSEFEGYYGATGQAIPRVPPITINGVDYFTPQQSRDIQAERAMDSYLQGLAKLDREGDYTRLLADPVASQMLAEFGVLPDIPLDQYRAAYAPFSAITPQTNYRNLKNYFAILNTANQIRTDAFFTKGTGLSNYDPYLEDMKKDILPPTKNFMGMTYDYAQYNSITDTGSHTYVNPTGPICSLAQLSNIPTMNEFEARHQQLHFRIIGRKLNRMQKANVAGFFGVPPSKINLGKRGGLAFVK